MLGGKHRHFIWVILLVVVDDWFHGLLIIFTTVVRVDRMALDVDNAWALAQFAANLEPLLNLIFVKAWCPVVWLHLWETAAFRSRFRDCTVPVLILLVDQLDLRL